MTSLASTRKRKLAPTRLAILTEVGRAVALNGVEGSAVVLRRLFKQLQTQGTKSISQFLSLLFLLSFCHAAWAHPMGNFSVNHYSRISLEGDRIRVRYLIDLAEIPTYQELQQANIPTTAIDPTSTTVINYVTARGTELGRSLSLDVNGKPTPLRLITSGVIFPPGAGGLPTMKMGFDFEADYPATLSAQERQKSTLHYVDNNYPGHTGWKEIISEAHAGSMLHSSVPATDRSGELSNYPTDLLTSPPQDLEASLVVVLPIVPTTSVDSKRVRPSQAVTVPAAKTAPIPAHQMLPAQLKSSAVPPSVVPVQSPRAVASRSASMHLEANRQQTPRNKFTELIQAEHLSPWFLFTAALIAIGLGGLHALEPGHGKTIVAAYLVGSKGTARHAALLGMIVTVSHTAGVFALGAITLYASRYIVPEQLYPWLGALSGITIAGLGLYMLMRRLTGTASDHSHAPGASHGHWMFWKRTENAEPEGNTTPNNTTPAQQVSITQLFTLGITGGIIPCPAALVVLLSAFALHRIGLGFFLIVAFSIGLAGVLIGFGMAMVYARRFMTRLQIDGPLTRRWLPVASSAFITTLGLILAIQALSTVHLNLHLFSKERLGPVLFVTILGLILGMRHSTDADHVVAISTIVSKQRSIRNAAFIGSVWGLGHTITIFIVGSLIILFGVEIPPRLGLSMEFCVALMLVLLGILNLSGVMQKVTSFFTPAIARGTDTHVPAALDNRERTMWKPFENPVTRLGWYQCLRPLVIGLVHGLAGSAAVALLVLTTIHNPVWATVYLLIFGAGTMIGMMCMTAAIAVPLTFAGDRFAKMSRYLGAVSGMASLCFGSFLVYQLGFLGGLFTSHPQWTPQ
jgi:ABC-type nickel/cobalt efflux system permease component RcnA